MMKLLITGVWICGVALASVYFSVQISNKKENAEPIPAMFGGLETIRGEVTSIPVINGGSVNGYFITRLSYTIDAAKAARLTIPIDVLVTDSLYTALVGEQIIRFPDIEKFDLEAFRAHVRDTLNEKLGDEVFHDVVVEQIDFLSKDDIRSNMRRGERNMKGGALVDEGSAEEPASAPSH